MKARLLLGGVIAVALAAPSLQGQSLAQVESLSRDGRVAEARTELTAWTEASWRAASREERQEALWYRGVLTLDPAQASRSFRRLAVEYPGSPWSARALLRLARIALLEDDLLEAAARFEDLRRDYPASAARLDAVEWLDENSARVAERRAEAEATVEDAADVGDASVAAEEPSPTRDEDLAADRTPAVDAPPPALEDRADARDEATSARWGVQLGAFGEPERAQALAERVRSAGFTPRLVRVPGSDLVRVRVGAFTGAESANALYDRLVAAAFEATVVNDVSREEPIGEFAEPA